MSMKSSPTTYGAVAVSIHWLSVVLILALLASGMLADETADPAAKARILAAHAPMGIAILLLTLARIVWWWRFDAHPAPLSGDPAWQVKSAKGVHGLLYLVVIGMAASGIGMFALSGAGDIVFGGAPGRCPISEISRRACPTASAASCSSSCSSPTRPQPSTTISSSAT